MTKRSFAPPPPREGCAGRPWGHDLCHAEGTRHKRRANTSRGMNNAPVGTTRLYMDEKRFTFIPSAGLDSPADIKPSWPTTDTRSGVNNGGPITAGKRHDDARKPRGDGSRAVPAWKFIRRMRIARHHQRRSDRIVQLYGSVSAMAVVTDLNAPGHVFMLFEHPKGWLNSLTTDLCRSGHHDSVLQGNGKVFGNGPMPGLERTCVTFVRRIRRGRVAR